MSDTHLKLTAVIGSAAVLLVALTSQSEGVRLQPYNDKLGNNVATVCYGDTEVPMRTYVLEECKALLSDRLADYAQAVRKLTPGFDTLTDGQKVAAVDFAYNLGVGAYQRSTLRQMYSAGRFPEACDQFLRYRYAGAGEARKDCSIAANKCGGLYIRRVAQRRICLGGGVK